MRHRKQGRKLGRNPSHQRALRRNLASALFLTERVTTEFDDNAPKVPGRVVTTLAKAKEVRPLVEKCITVARKGLAAEDQAQQFSTSAERGSEEWKSWRNGEQWRKWSNAMSPAVAARRRCLQLLGDKEAVAVLFEDVAPRFVDRPGGYTRILRLAKPRLGDSGTQAILEFVGRNDRVKVESQRPAFDDDAEELDDDAAESAGLDEETATADSSEDVTEENLEAEAASSEEAATDQEEKT